MLTRLPPLLSFKSDSQPAVNVQGVTISNDGATIMKLLDIVHPAAKTLVNISMSQDAEVSISGPWSRGCMYHGTRDLT